MTIFNQIAQLEPGHLPPITLLFGEDTSILSEAKQQLLDQVAFDPSNLSQGYYELTKDNSDAALEDLESLPFFDDERLVILSGLSNLSTAKQAVLDDKQLGRLADFIASPLETTKLILIVPGKLDSRLKIVKQVKKVAQMLEAQSLDDKALTAYFAQELTGDALKLLLERSNYQFGIAKQNMALLKTYKPDGITVEDVAHAVPKSLQDNIFDMTNFLIQGKLKETRELVADLVLNGEDEVKLLAVLTQQIRLYYQVKLYQQSGQSEAEQAKGLAVHPYRIKLANQTVRRLRLGRLQKALATLIETDYQIKTSYADKSYLLDLALIRLREALE